MKKIPRSSAGARISMVPSVVSPSVVSRSDVSRSEILPSAVSANVTPNPSTTAPSESLGKAALVGEAVVRTLRAIVGAPDYENYLAHVLEHHPDKAPMTREEVAKDRLENRYDKPGNRCC
jgi:uncharacterized short protein YbdD (DUF466 family)